MPPVGPIFSKRVLDLVKAIKDLHPEKSYTYTEELELECLIARELDDYGSEVIEYTRGRVEVVQNSILVTNESSELSGNNFNELSDMTANIAFLSSGEYVHVDDLEEFVHIDEVENRINECRSVVFKEMDKLVEARFKAAIDSGEYVRWNTTGEVKKGRRSVME